MKPYHNETTQMLCTRIAEECTEVGKEALKAVRFGLHATHPIAHPKTSYYKELLEEYRQLSLLVTELQTRIDGGWE